MKRSFFSLVLMVTVGVLAIGGGERVLAQPDEWGEPDWWADVCDVCSFRVHDDGATVTPECNYVEDVCDPGAAPCDDIDAKFPAVETTINGRDVTIRFWNWWIPTNTKDVRIKVQGTGGVAGSPPTGITAEGEIWRCDDTNAICNTDADCGGGSCNVVIVGLPDSTSRVIGVTASGVDATGNWWVEIHVRITPQPKRTRIDFTIPAAASRADVVVTASWSSSCCDLTRGACVFEGACQDLTETECDALPGKYLGDDTSCAEEIPAVSEWGLLVMVLLGLAAGTIMFRRARAVAA